MRSARRAGVTTVLEAEGGVEGGGIAVVPLLACRAMGSRKELLDFMMAVSRRVDRLYGSIALCAEQHGM